MPRCDNCHPAPHGGTLTDCLGCHDNPHAPLRPAGMQQLSEKCGDCHRKPAKQLAEFPSAHSRQGCTTCHSERHGRIPECTECHKPHYDEPNTGACWVCHPAHQPLQITLAADTAPKYCATCHSDVFTVWSGTTSRHGQVNCAVCHVQHARIPACLDCHQPPHDEKMLARFKNCLGCHIDPHNLPTNYK
jgi:predicted CXXCH cytochrome family protein